jgi:hypothetical protein
MSMRTVERPAAPGAWDDNQSSDLVSGTFVIVVCFGLVCLFLIAMAN